MCEYGVFCSGVGWGRLVASSETSVPKPEQRHTKAKLGSKPDIIGMAPGASLSSLGADICHTIPIKQDQVDFF